MKPAGRGAASRTCQRNDRVGKVGHMVIHPWFVITSGPVPRARLEQRGGELGGDLYFLRIGSAKAISGAPGDWNTHSR
jgi:hypothetical protein